MTNKIKPLYGLLIFIILARVFSMITLPLTDTTEARYAHTAYLMSVTNDWITPYFDVGVPFWGKPPFSFWAEAISYKIFGFNDFSARFPALLFTFTTMALIYIYLKRFHSKQSALWGSVIYFTLLLSYALSGAVLTDPYLTFSTTLAMISFIMVIKKQERYWGYLFFIALGIGMLAKGPLAIVIIGGGVFFWIVLDFKIRLKELKKFPIVKGSLVALIISIPWYILAELKTPGFLDYFIVGEHFKRFIDAGWSGDLYGSSHKRAHGTIWLLWLASTFPWIFLAISALIKQLRSKLLISSFIGEDKAVSYFVIWAIFTTSFFTLAGNVLWTYVLPALPAFAILLAIYLKKIDYKIEIKGVNTLYIFALFVPITLIIINIYLLNNPDKLPTQKRLIAYYKQHKKDDGKLYFIQKRPFSAQYYSNDKAVLVLLPNEKTKSHSNVISFKKFTAYLKKSDFVAIDKDDYKIIQKLIKLPLTKQFQNKDFILLSISKEP